MAFLVGSTAPGLQRLAVPFASLLIATLGYGSQWLFFTSPDLEPGPLTPTQTRFFNILLVCLWWTYWRACTVDPGRYEFPRSSLKKGVGGKRKEGEDGAISQSSEDEDHENEDGHGEDRSNNTKDTGRTTVRRRWCRKCAAPKPPRAHHCKGCGRCIPRMDHHCPWTANCVSLQTFPHFARFIIYTNASLWTLGYFLWERFAALWASRHLPAYLGPTLAQLAAFTALCLTTFLTALVLGILLVTTVRGWALNTTMIEGWEIERHEAVLQRGGRGYEEEDWWRTSDGDLDAAPRSMVDPVEFPYDIGVFANMAQAMGSSNPLYWLLPFADGPRIARLPASITPDDLVAMLDGAKAGAAKLGTGWYYEENGMNDREGMWPPIDPEKVRNARLWRQRRREEEQYRREQMQGLRDPALPDMSLSPEEEKEAFRRRQERDLQRWRGARDDIMRELEEIPDSSPYAGQGVMSSRSKSRWVNADGEHLGDYGVDEDAEFDEDYVFDGRGQDVQDGHISHVIIDHDDEEVPLAELIRRRKVRTKDGDI